MKLHTLGRMVIAFASVVAALAGCSWENPLYTNFAEKGDVVFCPTMDENGVREKKKFDYFMIFSRKCLEDNFSECISNAMTEINCGDNKAVCELYKDVDYSNAFEYGLCPIGYDCHQDNEGLYYCKAIQDCFSDEILCQGRCISKNFHVDSCENGKLICENGYADCNNDLMDGCEEDTAVSSDYCGADADCKEGKVCREEQQCFNGECIDKCLSNETFCYEEGQCFDLNNDKNHCGDCYTNCLDSLPENSRFSKCQNGVCVYVCEDGFRGYDGLGGTEITYSSDAIDEFICLNDYNDPKHCGASAMVCGEKEECIDGECVAFCEPPQNICYVDGKRECVDIKGTNVNHCGGCHYRCDENAPGINLEVEACVAGECIYRCTEGTMNCSTDESQLVCVSREHFMTDSKHCGGCNHECSEGEACVDGKCTLTSCQNDTTLCLMNGERKCLNVLGNDVDNCGSCGYSCKSSALVTASSNACKDGKCVYQCNSGLINCGQGNAMSEIHCVDSKNNIDHCGSCNYSCRLHPKANAVANYCRDGKCQYSCNSGYTNCGSAVSPNCINVKATDIKHCGSCTNDCSVKKVTNGKGTSCKAGVCQYSCNSGYTNCGNAASPSCRNTKGSDNNNCGGCNKKCLKPSNAKSAQCSKGTCKITCKSGYKLKKGKCVK